MVGETNSMVGYHLMAEDHSVQLGYGTVSPPPAGPGQCLNNDNNNNIIIIIPVIIFSEFLINHNQISVSSSL